jgi:RimJ/RimL family protein N-acetyltransferase
VDEARLELRDGSAVVVRAIRPGDREAIRDAFSRLGPETRYRRFLSAVERLSDSDLRYLTEVDHSDHEALVAYDAESREGAGVARYVRDPDNPRLAEAAVVVSDDWQGRGLGTALCRMLAERAREEGIEAFAATLLAENRQAIHLIESLGPSRVVGTDGATIKVEVAIPHEGIGEGMRELLRTTARGLVHLRTRR